ncbi:Transmembrane protein 120B [Acropora cervicornis]|uniref:Transmembrane protein 120B n=1 Tax=Acropora cervicornis TaxID=6130 RepID=A0AAD9R6L6_ACRCE|nr:Transmembrane protein 120B [Acropora cervicornis]
MIDEGIKCCEVEKNCSIYSGLCNPAWVVPLYIPQTAAILHSEVLDSGIGPDVNFHRLTVHINAFHLSINDTLHSGFGKEVSELQSIINNPMPVNCLPNMAPVCIITSRELADHIIYTNTEFENIAFLRIQLGDSAGLFEIRAEASQIKIRVERAPSEFHEQTDLDGLNACQFLKLQKQLTGSELCQVISGSVSGAVPGAFVVLVKLETLQGHTFHLLLYEDIWDSWVEIDPETASYQDSQDAELILDGLSFTAFVSKSLFLWGNNLLYSPDGGHSIRWLTSFPSNSTIVVFTSSPFDGLFAFLTHDREVWIGQVGSSGVQRLKSSAVPRKLSPDLYDKRDSSTLSIFFDSGGGLQQIVIGRDPSRETGCISREELPVGKIISRQIFSRTREEMIMAHKRARSNSTSCFQEQSTRLFQLKDVQRACPFARIFFEATHDVLYTRKCFYQFEPAFKLGSSLVHSSTDAHEYFSKVYKTVKPDCADNRDHPWSLIDLHASFEVSDAQVLNVSANRTELVARKAVKYEVWKSSLSCSNSYGVTGSLEGSYVMSVLLGCPAGFKLIFDPEASKRATGQEHFCSDVHGVPCFYFYRVFKLLDLVTGKISRFLGKYTLKIVGGGPDHGSITDYTEEEQTKYNYHTTGSMAPLIWASKVKTLGGIPVFTSNTNGISWLCGTQSPCADIGPNFPGNAEYYFKMKFSNREVDADSSNCNFTIRFLIRIHGLPPGSLNPSSVIVLQTKFQDYQLKMDEFHAIQKSCVSGVNQQKRKLADFRQSLKHHQLQLKMADLERQIKAFEISLPSQAGLEYKNDYENFKFKMILISMLFTILDLYVFNYRIKGWWVAHHYVSIILSGLLLIWPDGTVYQLFRKQFFYFSLYLAFVQLLQFRYQSGVLYRLRALGISHSMDITKEGFQSWMWRGLGFVIPFLIVGYVFQLYNAYTLYRLSFHPECTDWQVLALSVVFFTLFAGNMTTLLYVLQQKITKTWRVPEMPCG